MVGEEREAGLCVRTHAHTHNKIGSLKECFKKGPDKEDQRQAFLGLGMWEPSASDQDSDLQRWEAWCDAAILLAQGTVSPAPFLAGPQRCQAAVFALMTLKQKKQQDSGELRGPGARWGPARG